MKISFGNILPKIKKDYQGVAWLDYLFFFLVYSIFFYPIKNGVGQFWDWTTPFFSDQVPNVFLRQSSSWSSVALGKPLGYSTDYFFRILQSFTSLISPELAKFFLLVLSFSAGSYFIFQITKERGRLLGSLTALAIFVNPLMFYKVNAGHFNYIVSFVIFLGLISFLILKYEKTNFHIICLALIYAFIGMQIQFFFFALAFILFYFIFYREKFSIKSFVLIGGITLLINLVWLMNFFSGGVDVIDVSTQASKIIFPASINTTMTNILELSFSRASLIHNYYNHYVLIGFILLPLLLYWIIYHKKIGSRKKFLIVSFLLFLIFFALKGSVILGIYPLSIILPMFREVGHVGPIYFLFFILSLHFLFDGVLKEKYISAVFIVFIIFNGYAFVVNYQSINFSRIRAYFEPFKVLLDNDTSQYRVLSYPFFDQYGIKEFPTPRTGNFPLGNSGHDSFASFAYQSFIDNAIPPHLFKKSIQYQLLRDLNLANLNIANVKYIFDFSDFYESNYDNFVPTSTYDNDKSIIKNDESFFDRLLVNNKGSLEKINDHMYQLKNFNPYVFSFKSVYLINKKNDFEYANDIEKKYDFATEELRSDFYFSFPDGDKKILPLATFSDPFENISPENISPNSKEMRSDVMLPGGERKVVLYEKNDLSASEDGNNKEEDGFKKTQLERSEGRDVTVIFANEKYEYQNVAKNPSLEDGLWEEKVGDCNNKDKNPILGMSLAGDEKTDGVQSLQLEAVNHVACTSQKIPVKGGSSYLLSFDYQSPNAKQASYYIGFNDEQKTAISESLDIKDGNWNSFSKTIKVPDGATSLSLYVYARSVDGKTNIINRYDNFKLIEVPDLSDRFYVVSEPVGEDGSPVQLKEPESISFDLLNPTKKLVHIKGATTPFFLGMSESYHPQWQLQMNNQKINGFFASWMPLVKPDRVGDEYHYKLNDFLNGWYVDPATLCVQNSACTQNADGSYDMEMTVEFFPQRWFYLGLLISGSTLAACLAYLATTWLRSKRGTSSEKEQFS